MRIPTIEISYTDIASRGLDGKVRDYGLDNDFLGIGCHKGFRRSVAAMLVLQYAQIPIANIPNKVPTINYDDFIKRKKFIVQADGLMIPGKTDYPFPYLMLFTDDSKEESVGIKKIREILDVEARGVLQYIILAHVLDQSGLLGME